jgi:hypothetical protein
VKSIASLIAVAICILVLPGLAGPDLASANGYQWKHQWHHGIALVEPRPPCEVGWWQTLRYGHVRPRWGMRCY